MKKTLAAFAMTSLLLAGSTFAAEGEQKDRGGRWQKLDTDGDGRISRAEFDAMQTQNAQANTERRAKAFARMDANSDGFVTQDEMKAAREKFGKRRHHKQQQQQDQQQ